MAAVVAQAHFIFGLRTGVTNNLCFSDEHTVVFPSGNNCVCYNSVQGCQRFIQGEPAACQVLEKDTSDSDVGISIFPGSEKSRAMRALAISANRRYLAVSERGERATVTVFDLQHEQGRKRKVLTAAADVLDQEFVCVAFSPDSKYLIAQTGGPEGMLVFWLWEKQKVLALVKTSTSNNPVTQVRKVWDVSVVLPGGMDTESMLECFLHVPSGQLQPSQQHAAVCERKRGVQAVPLLRGSPEAEQLPKGGDHQLPVPRLGVRGAGDRWDGHGQAAGV